MPAIGRRGPKHEAVPGLANIEVHKAAGPVPVGGKSAGTLVLKCSVAGCDWEVTATTTRPAFHHSASRHPGLGTHLFEPMSREEVELKKRQRRAESERERRSRVKKAKEEASQTSTGEAKEEAISSYDAWVPVIWCPSESVRRLDGMPDGPVTISGSMHGVQAQTLSQRIHGTGMPGRASLHLSCSSVTADHSLRIAITWAANQLACSSALRHWLGLRKRDVSRRGGGNAKSLQRVTKLFLADEELRFEMSPLSAKVGGRSAGVAAAVSLVCLASDRSPVKRVAMTGAMDLRGNVLGVSGLRGKLKACKYQDVHLFLVPQESIDDFKQRGEDKDLEPELQEYAAKVLRGVTSITEVLQLSLEDCEPLPPPLAATGLPEAGVGVGMSLLHVPSNGARTPLFVEAAFVRAGKLGPNGPEVYVTGAEGGTMAALPGVVDTARGWILDEADQIQEILQLGSDWSKALESYDLHVNFERFHSQVDNTVEHYVAVVAIAIICCLTGRRQRRDTAVGGFEAPGAVIAGKAFIRDEDNIEKLQLQGFRRLVIPGIHVIAEGLLPKLHDAHIQMVLGGNLPCPSSFLVLLPSILEGTV